MSEKNVNSTSSIFAAKIPLRSILIVPFLLQITVAVGLTGWLSLRNGQKAVNDLVQQLQLEVENRITQHLNDYLEKPVELNTFNAESLRINVLNTTDISGLERRFWQQIRVYTDVQYIYFASAQGGYIGAGRESEPAAVTIEGTPNFVPGDFQSWLTNDQGQRTELLYSEPDYDPRRRDWYKDAIAAGAPSWSDIYIFVDNQIGISATHPIFDASGNPQGVLAVDYLLTGMGQFLKSVPGSPHGTTFIMERSGLLVASSTSEKPYIPADDPDGEVERLSARQSQYPAIQSTVAAFTQQVADFSELTEPLQFRYTLEGERQFVRVIPLEFQGLDWLIVVVMPESDFMAQINANTRTTIVLCGVALAIATWLGIYTSRWISQPILKLNRATQSIATGDISQQLDTSNINEISQLSHSFNRMVQQLEASFAALAKTNEQLETRVTERTTELRQALHDLQKAQTCMIQAEKMSSLGILVAGLAHEINNPINFIHGNLTYANEYVSIFIEILEAYQREFPNPSIALQEQLEELDVDYIKADFIRLLASMKVGSERIREIVKSLRTFSRLDEANLKEVDLHAGIDSTLMILQHRLKAKSDRPAIQLVKEYGELPLVECYSGQLNQVFMNVLANAIDSFDEMNQTRSVDEIKAHPDQITIRTRVLETQWVEVAIADNGPGMDTAAQNRLFDPFFTTKAIGKGTGLGLSISYQIVTERHDGKLLCHSSLGEGSTFIIQIPIHRPRPYPLPSPDHHSIAE
ncbi:ATP-binding protein [Spirulina major CS-329]|uniref:ATP-binding protein n=1 Tax=Spirulina TaxID=1154 RepID=UPI00232D8475|nr:MULTISPECIES: ATP-binding protein [Spirulina]MDB9493041.1 ATP-binding protein [Spirulina subsalsa CS-330]MDB9501471.1 ATP-binding protein [Spirulina major CS-329]